MSVGAMMRRKTEEYDRLRVEVLNGGFFIF